MKWEEGEKWKREMEWVKTPWNREDEDQQRVCFAQAFGLSISRFVIWKKREMDKFHSHRIDT